MVSTEGLRRRIPRTMEMLEHFPAHTPQAVQLYGYDPQAFVEATQLICAETDFQAIDINMGCPVKKIVRHGAGAGLLCDPPRLRQIVAATRRHSPRPLTVKIRLGLAQVNVFEIARIIQGEGADALAVHFRLQSEMFSGQAHWTYAAPLKERLAIPLIGNGDIHTPDQARQRLTQCDAVMIGRGAVADPAIFLRIQHPTQAPGPHALAQRLCELVETQCHPRYRMGKLKAHVRYMRPLLLHGAAQRQAVFSAPDFAVTKARLLEITGASQAVS
jgi:hypothetical protein